MSKDEERYDVSQHDGITKGKWEIRRSGSSIDVVVYADDEKRAFSPIINFTREYADAVMKIDRDRADLEAIASLPEILDALKKAYEREDEHNKQVYSPNARKTLVEHCVPILNYIEMYRGNMSDEELMQDILTGGYYDEPDVWENASE